MKKLLSSLLVAAMAFTLAGCGGKGDSSGLTTYHDYELTRQEIENFNLLTSAQSKDLNVLTNCVDGLVEHDTDGNIIPALAEKWEPNDDKTVWTFHLRDGLQWINNKGEKVADVTAEDFVTALKYILTAENNSNNTSMPMEMVKGAAEYYEASLAGTATDELWAQVGIKAVDEKTVEYTMVAPKPYFDTAVAYAAFYPAPTDFLKEQGSAYGTGIDTILYNGCYYLTSFESGANKSYKKNPTYWDTKNVPFDEVTVVMLESQDRALDMFEAGELDRALLTQEQIVTQTKANDKRLVETRVGQHVYSMYFNYTLDASQPGAADWNAAVANENFRKAWYYGMDFTEIVKFVNPYSYESMMSNVYSPETLSKNSKGVDYTDIGALAEYNPDKSQARLDEAKFKEAKEKAMSELTAQGVTFPVQVYVAYQSGSKTEEDKFQIAKKAYEDSLGTDMIQVTGVPYIKSSVSEVYNKNLQSIMTGGWGADYGDPYNFVYQLSSEPGNYMNVKYSHFTDETYNKMVDEANEIIDLDARYEAFAACEAYALEHALIVPGYVNGVEWQVTKVNDYSKPYAKYGIANRKMKYWETKAEAYTADEYKTLAEKAAKSN